MWPSDCQYSNHRYLFFDKLDSSPVFSKDGSGQNVSQLYHFDRFAPESAIQEYLLINIFQHTLIYACHINGVCWFAGL